MDKLMRAATLALAAMLLLGNSQCQSTNNSSSTSPAFVTTLAVEDANGNPATTFSQGQSIQFVLTVRNRTDMNQSINTSICFPQYAMAVVTAHTSNAVNYLTSSIGFNGLICQKVGIAQMTIPAGQTVTGTLSWDQTDANGQLVAPGNYEVMGGAICYTDTNPADVDTVDCMSPQFTSDELTPTELRSDLVQFTIQ